MAVTIPYVRDFDFAYGRSDVVSPSIRRVIANNPGPFTYRGTATFIVGHGEVAVIDPGPDLPEHLDALIAALALFLAALMVGALFAKTTSRGTAGQKAPSAAH